ncbi:hypothetical protein RBH26_11975 [Natronolimnohabitans sp. A-GB9]|uniref:hypothetical protein n=1 Tax=Natronolimnohabitans sp. A-GB9 TaxID=3069757 RepID=UPI0027B7C33D|nr:hypothetical protein [Natronolimnohabitans sp. A-GB9]MDQ2051197.1 hypothetical protein [Natronolimnohabitans sp. A-GB9]
MAPLGLRPRVYSAVLWGIVGFLAFLVLVQGYALAVDPLVSLAQGAAIAALVGVGTTACAYRLEHRVAEWSARRALRENDSHETDDKSKS